MSDYIVDESKWMVTVLVEPKVLVSLQSAIDAYLAGDWYKVHALVRTAQSEMIENSGRRDKILPQMAHDSISQTVKLANMVYQVDGFTPRMFV